MVSIVAAPPAQKQPSAARLGDDARRWSVRTPWGHPEEHEEEEAGPHPQPHHHKEEARGLRTTESMHNTVT